MEDRGRSSRTYENRRTYGKSQGRSPSDNHPSRRQRTPAERAHDTICPVDHINHCSNCRNHFVETLQPIKRTI